jgi:hypothetical protein
MPGNWTLNRMLAWIHHRTKKAVAAEHETEHLWATLTPVLPGETGFKSWRELVAWRRLQRRREEHRLRPLPEPVNPLEQRRLATLSTMPILFSRDGARALACLQPFLEDGRVRSSGLRKPNGEREQIPPLNWPDLSLGVQPGGKPTEVVLYNRTGVAVWHWLLFNVDDGEKWFPAPVRRRPKPKPEPAPVEAMPEPARKPQADWLHSLTPLVRSFVEALQEMYPRRPKRTEKKVKEMLRELAERYPALKRKSADGGLRSLQAALGALAKRFPEKWSA